MYRIPAQADDFRAAPRPFPGLRRLTPLAALAAALLLAAAAPAFAQPGTAAQENPAAGTFGDTVDVRVVNVEAVVTGPDGERVSGLGPGDLRLVVDGREVPIDYFTEVHGGVAVAPAGRPGAGDYGAGVPGVPAAGAGGEVGTSYLVFIDDDFPVQRDRDRVLRALMDDLGHLGPADRMAIVAFDGSRVEMLTSWTDSPRRLDAAIAAALERPAYGLQRLARERGFETALLRRDRYARRPGAGFADLAVDERGYAREVENRVERVVSAAVATLRGFAQPPGRKVMLLLSGGWPVSSAAYVVNDPLRPVAAYDYGSGPRTFQPLTDTANLLGYTLYPVDVPGFNPGFAGDVEQAGRDGRFGPDPSPLRSSTERERLVHDSLYLLAEETGGVPLINSARQAALAEVAADTRSYYWLGFTVDRSRDDARHDIRVEAARPGLEVRSRAGFRDLSRRVEGDMAVESALLFGGGASGGRLVAELGTPEKSGWHTMAVPLTLAIPTGAFTTLPEGGEQVARLELRVAALDDGNRMSDVPMVPLELRFAAVPPEGGAVSYATRLELRRQPQDLVLSVNDPVSGQQLMTRLRVSP